MTSWALLAAAVAFVPVQLFSQVQARPDFSGKWTLATKSVRGPGDPRFRSCTAELLLVQDHATLSVQSGNDASRATIHRFDGSDRVVPYPPVPARREGLSPTAWEGHTTRFVSRAAWNGDQFVIATHSTMRMTWPSQMPGEFDRETATKAVYAYNEAGQLVVEHLVLTDLLPGGSTKRLEFPDSWTCTYVKPGQANASVRPSGVTSVFVGSPAATQQTTELTASVAELRKALEQQSSLWLVDSPEAADVIVNVRDRQWKAMVAGSESWGDNPEASRPNYNTWARLTIELQGKGFSTSMFAQAKSWNGAASQAASDVAKWIDANRRMVDR